MDFRFPFTRVAAVAAALFLGAQAYAQNADDELLHQHLKPEVANMIARLQTGGHVLVIRHERTNAYIPDQPDYQVENCATQRNLSVAGAANAVENGGVILRFLEIPIGNVLASPMCRTLETGRLMFGDVTANPALQGYGQEPEMVRAEFEQLIIDGAGQPENTALITHLGTFTFVNGGHLAEGDAAVFSVQDGAPVQIGTIPANAWNDAVIDASMRARNMDANDHSHDHH
ncbi:MAG: hypothetical protein ACRBB0_05565 [Pelagimonas sp.]|uniref:hypothetical protein n=1 Tax=Pelagimonas sp. TaxID=2073170 RepID=UPI003D6B27ED